MILDLAENRGQVRPRVEEKINDFAARGFRSLGVARTDVNDRWQFLGVLPLSDPPLEDSKSTIETARDMGVQVKMVTGDQVAIGKEIAKTRIMECCLHYGGGFEDYPYAKWS